MPDSKLSASQVQNYRSSAILHLVNQSGGGTMRYIESLIHSNVMPFRSFVWYVGKNQHILFDVATPYYYAFSAQLSLQEQQNLVLSLIQDVGVTDLSLHLHSFWGQALTLAEHWKKTTTLPFTATFHDHHFLGETPFVDGQLVVDEAHTGRISKLLENAEIIVPSKYLYQQALPYHDAKKLHIIAHGNEVNETRAKPLDTDTLAFVDKLKRQANWNKETLTVATIGAIDENKGLAAMKEWLSVRGDVQFVCIGYTGDFAADEIRPQATTKNITHGFYHYAEVPELLSAYHVDVVIFFPGIAESFCYALSDINGRVPVLVPNNGALGERVVDEQLGNVYPIDLPPNAFTSYLQQTAKRSINTPKHQTLETMTLKTAHYYQKHAIDSVLQKKLSFPAMSALLDEQLHADNLKWEMALLVRQHYDLTNDVASLKTELQKYTKELQIRDSELQKRNNELQQQDSELKRQHNELQKRDDELQKRDDELKKRNNELQQQDNELKKQSAFIESLQSHVAHQQQTISGAGATIDAMQKTLSWKITRPLRSVRQLLKKKQIMEENKRHITVVLPIYRDTAMTMDCIRSALPSISAIDGARLVLINDASPEADMQGALSLIAEQYSDTITLLTNDSNLGFVATVNRGMKTFPDTDVVLLNSDVILPDETWLQRLADDAYSGKDIASVTPLSNNTTICTFPEFLQDNPLPFGLTVGQVDSAFRGEKYACVEAPTGVGFCMYIRRTALEAVGYFDEAAFGRGYGEENDFCQRAIQAGFRNVISPNLYAYHLGGVSFGEDKQSLIENASRIIDRRYPSYHSNVQVFIANDPLQEARICRFTQLIASSRLPKVLHISHGTGGGVGQHIEELASALENRLISLTLVPEGDKGMVKLSLAISATADSLFFDFDKDYEALVALLQHLGIGLLHYHHTVRFGENIFRLPDSLGVAHIFTLHDFYLLGGNPTLSDETGVYPGYFDERLQNPMYPYPKNVTREQFRSQHRQLVENVQMVIAPSRATLDIFADIYHLPKAQVIPHLEMLRPQDTPIALVKKKVFTIGVFGAISREKGADLVEGMARYAKQQGLPLKFTIIGYAYRSLKGVTVTGPFEREQLLQQIQTQAIDVAFFSARWPETYSYTLSYALEAGLPIFAPNLGAFPERLTERPLTAFFNHLDDEEAITKHLHDFIAMNQGKSAKSWTVPNQLIAQEFYLGDYLSSIESPEIKIGFKPSKMINVSQKPSARLNAKEKLVVKLWKIYTHPSMRWINIVIPFRVRRGLKRLLSRQAIHDLVNKHEGQ